MTGMVTIGTCSLCGGPVQVHAVWMSIVPEVPTCAECGATASSHGPVIDMKPAPPSRGYYKSTTSNLTVDDDGTLTTTLTISGGL